MKNGKIRIAALLLALAMVLAFAGCGTTDPMGEQIQIIYDKVMALQAEVNAMVYGEEVLGNTNFADHNTLTEQSLLPYMQFYDLCVVVGTEIQDSDYLEAVDIFNQSTVVDIIVDHSDVDANVTGNYNLIYNVTVALDGLEYEMTVKKTVHIVTAENYAAMVDAGEIFEFSDGVAISIAVESQIAVDDALTEDDTDVPGSATDVQPDDGTSSEFYGMPALTAPYLPERPVSTDDPVSTTTPGTIETAAPSPTTGADHTHSYTSTITTVATCTTDGVRTYVCSCGDTYTETIPATGHTWVTDTLDDGYYDTITVVDQEAYDEYIAAYWTCNACNATFSTGEGFDEHNETVHASSASATKADSQTIHHDAATHTEQVWVGSTYTVVKCSVCGATQ